MTFIKKNSNFVYVIPQLRKSKDSFSAHAHGEYAVINK